MSLPPTVFTFPVRVYWEDTDAGGIVFYANYLKFFERARTEWLRALGVQQRLLVQTHGGMFVVSQTQMKYHRPARLDDALMVTAQLGRVGQASLIFEQQAFLQTADGEPTLLCEGSIRVGWVDHETLKPAKIPHHVLELLK